MAKFPHGGSIAPAVVARQSRADAAERPWCRTCRPLKSWLCHAFPRIEPGHPPFFGIPLVVEEGKGKMNMKIKTGMYLGRRAAGRWSCRRRRPADARLSSPDAQHASIPTPPSPITQRLPRHQAHQLGRAIPPSSPTIMCWCCSTRWRRRRSPIPRSPPFGISAGTRWMSGQEVPSLLTQGFKFAPLWTGIGDGKVTISSDTFPGKGGIYGLGETQEQMADAPGQGRQAGWRRRLCLSQRPRQCADRSGGQSATRNASTIFTCGKTNPSAPSSGTSTI